MPFAVALENRLLQCPRVTTLGVRPNFSDYSPREQALIRKAETIYYPSQFYAPMFQAMGKKTFPGPAAYTFAQDKIAQTGLFKILDIPHPRTKVYYGDRQKRNILRDFVLPVVGKVPRGSARGKGVFLIKTTDQLVDYCKIGHTAYIQEYLRIDRDVRVVVIGSQVILAYWRVAGENGFLNNVAAGGEIAFDAIPDKVTDLALDTAIRCGWNDVGLDLCLVDGEPLVIEANMKYGRQGFALAGIDYYILMETLIADGKI
ncbi:MAG: RimK family alpha-L-glutamate ligase [Desulfatibacillum sp.]|nr:RimK family alpha-L-glutamate ligase [Desulfatibacillum sp.]